MAYMKKGRTTVRHARGIVVGCAGAGKTTLLYRLMGKSLEEIKEIKSTRGLHVYQHIFSVRKGDLTATEDESLKKPLIRIPASELQQEGQNPNDDSANIELEIDTGNNARLENIKADMSAGKEFNARQNTILAPKKNETDESRDERIDQQLTESERRKIYARGNDKNDEQLARDVMGKILDARENEISVSMIDFAGQFAYYACHQIYMRSEAFYILVTDMSKAFQDFVCSETDECEGSIFSTWTYKEYLYFWLESIKTFGGTSPKILAVATHAESKVKKERNCFWKSLWTSGPHEDKKWLRDCTGYKEFALELIEMGEEDSHDLKTEKQILSVSDINKVNEELPNGYQLKSQEEILDFLSFFHEHGMLLFFNDQELRTHVILDIQWFSNAFSKLIADEDHISRDCQRIYIEEWNSFNATGNLKNSLIDALWEDELYVQHKTELMSYMERLRMLVSIQKTEDEISWYVPYREWEYSSVLCFRFKSFALFIYYRLIAYCMSFLRWKVQMDNDNSPCLYLTAAIFETRNHTVLVGIFENDIQVQVLRIKNLQPKDSCLIGKTVENALTELTNSFEKQSFQKGYKCLNIFCSKLDTTFIPENELSGIQYNCPVGKEKHEINVRWTLAFWREKGENVCFATAVSSTGVFGDRTRFAKLGMAIIDVLTQTLRDILEKEIPSTHIYGKVNSTKLQKGVKGPNPEQEKLLNDAKKYGYQKFDITLLYMLIRNYCSKIDKPTNDWGLKTLPAAGEITVGDDVERIRLIRNEVYGHVSSASASQDEFDENWSIISDICRRLKKCTGKSYLKELDDIKEFSLGEDKQEAIIKQIQVVCEHDKEILEKMETMKTGILSLQTDTTLMKAELQEIKSAMTCGKKDLSVYRTETSEILTCPGTDTCRAQTCPGTGPIRDLRPVPVLVLIHAGHRPVRLRDPYHYCLKKVVCFYVKDRKSYDYICIY
ncbi:uncharacterized protein LOC133179908 [Saccostrea echinata]|uniref:uncharacterized protein LOC133179908 n=1 Tax=Saccostrea echinata TaxID=191078 RepID=UPI002A826ADF|nr:uncharacterized protein LOC133179908 [Saccostrea echinata]